VRTSEVPSESACVLWRQSTWKAPRCGELALGLGGKYGVVQASRPLLITSNRRPRFLRRAPRKPVQRPSARPPPPPSGTLKTKTHGRPILSHCGPCFNSSGSEANSIKQDYADIVSADYPNLKTIDSICKITPDLLAEHSKALQTFRERWALLRKEYAARLECTNSVEDALRNMSLADMSYGVCDLPVPLRLPART
jgi:hypothetical protein